MDLDDDLPDDVLDEIASLLAKGFLRYWKSQRMRPVITSPGAQMGLDSQPQQSLHVTVVNAKRTGENG